MSRTRFDDRLNDIDARVVGAAEADLHHLLAIEPSPEFAERVRAAIGRQRAEPRWGAAWITLAFASAAVIVLAAAVLFHQGDPVIDIPVAHEARLHDTLLAAPPPLATPVTPPPHFGSVRPRPARQVAAPEVVIDPSLADAISRVTAQARGKVAGPNAFENMGSSPSESQLSVPSVVVDPLDVPQLVLPPAEAAGSGTAGFTEHQKE
jgi:hypothetical protein